VKENAGGIELPSQREGRLTHLCGEKRGMTNLRRSEKSPSIIANAGARLSSQPNPAIKIIKERELHQHLVEKGVFAIYI